MHCNIFIRKLIKVTNIVSDTVNNIQYHKRCDKNEI